ncbi:MAG: hypothetical protein JXP34_09980 [Planctomycetes bacterium]|nr:hypothetical protein [Planctomycetota bacterium]
MPSRVRGSRLAAGLVALASAAAVSGCFTFGRMEEESPIDAEAVAQIEPGTSTKADVVRFLGAPDEVVYNNKEHDVLNEHAYVYRHGTRKVTAMFFGVLSFGRYDLRSDKVMVFFGPDGKVANVASQFRADDARFGFPFGR